MNRNRRFNNPSNNANRGRNSAPRRAVEFVIPIRPDYVTNDSLRIKHTKETTTAEGTTKETIYVPQLPESATPYQILDFFREFQDACDTMSWTAGADKFSKIRQHFQGIHKDSWDDALISVGISRSNDSFKEVRKSFLCQTFEATRDYDAQMDFLRSIKKPPEMQVKTFLQYLRIADKQVKMLPGAPDSGGLTVSELKKTFLEAMPRQWQLNYRNAGKTYNTDTLTSMRSYFDSQETEDPFIPRQRPNENNDQNNRNNQNNSVSNNRNRRSNQGQRQNNNNNQSQKHRKQEQPPRTA